MGYNPENGRKYIEIYTGLWPNVVATRLMGSAALGIAYTACGRLDLYFHVSLYPWDIAGGILLVREAGGVALQLDGKPTTYHNKDIVVSNKKVAGEFIANISKKA
jgi:myo-inositol-1(or 4)-monophosphatase